VSCACPQPTDGGLPSQEVGEPEVTAVERSPPPPRRRGRRGASPPRRRHPFEVVDLRRLTWNGRACENRHFPVTARLFGAGRGRVESTYRVGSSSSRAHSADRLLLDLPHAHASSAPRIATSPSGATSRQPATRGRCTNAELRAATRRVCHHATRGAARHVGSPVGTNLAVRRELRSRSCVRSPRPSVLLDHVPSAPSDHGKHIVGQVHFEDLAQAGLGVFDRRTSTIGLDASIEVFGASSRPSRCSRPRCRDRCRC